MKKDISSFFVVNLRISYLCIFLTQIVMGTKQYIVLARMVIQVVYFSRLQRHDRAWGRFDNETQEWNGMIRSLILKEIDISWASLTIGVERQTVVDFLPPYATETSCVVRH